MSAWGRSSSARRKARAKASETRGQRRPHRPPKEEQQQIASRARPYSAATERKPPRPAPREAPNHFEKKWNGPCPNHRFPVKHLLKDYSMMKKFIREEAKNGHSEKASEIGNQDSPNGDDEQGGPVLRRRKYWVMHK
ncbi:hypothetical protein PR202_ga31366 [Eleusine coracana subsp. coracana]|uniref:Uncharacterized protein n=1 Tax=Eleusine coracana subsp. coracana TaxID=191504 RepID=A0AAV5DQ25_ELECO|nr:hypothetical protein PR202_ga31366 [Eleusine coracana subsp. coracana]